jgi:hypothetical protein
MPVKNSSAAICRSPSGPAIVMRAPSARQQAGSSEAGSAWARLPPSVPRLRIAACERCGIAAAIKGTCRAISGARISST